MRAAGTNIDPYCLLSVSQSNKKSRTRTLTNTEVRCCNALSQLELLAPEEGPRDHPGEVQVTDVWGAQDPEWDEEFVYIVQDLNTCIHVEVMHKDVLKVRRPPCASRSRSPPHRWLCTPRV